MSRFQKRLRSFARDRRGAIGLIFGLAIVPLITLVGVAIDYMHAAQVKAAIQAAVDEAAIATAKHRAQGAGAGEACNYGHAVFNSYKNSAFKNQFFTGFADSRIYLGLTSACDAGRDTDDPVTANYRAGASVKTFFAGILKRSAVGFTANSTATFDKPRYKTFYFVVNASESMGIAATQADIDKLKSLTPGHCALACHVPETDQPPGTPSNESIARANGVTLRLDVVKQTIKDILDQVAADATMKQYFQFVIYPFAYTQPTVPAPSSDITSLKAQVDAIGLSHTSNPEGFTDHKSALQTVMNSIGAGGDGTSAASAQNFVFLATDGVEDLYYNRPGTAVASAPLFTSPVDFTDCDNIRTTNRATVGVVYTTYIPLGTDNYIKWVLPFESSIRPNLQRCASTNYFFEGTEADQISKAMKTMFTQAATSVRLTQ